MPNSVPAGPFRRAKQTVASGRKVFAAWVSGE